MLVIEIRHPEKNESYALEFWLRKNEPIFLRKNGGEGMGILMTDLYKMIDEWFEKNM